MLDEDNESETIDDTVINILLIYSSIDNLHFDPNKVILKS